MEYIINEDPSIFTERHEGKSYPFLAKEEIFSIVNEALGHSLPVLMEIEQVQEEFMLEQAE